MQQAFRRQLLALGRLGGSQELADSHCRQFIRSVLAASIDVRPHTEAVLDVLRSSGAPTAATTRFTETFEAAVWPIAGRPSL